MNKNPTPARALACARAWIGTPYLHQASVRGVGADCIGLVRGVWRELYGAEPQRMPNYSSTWADGSGTEDLLDAAARHFEPAEIAGAQPGEVLIFRMRRGFAAKHAGILAGPDRFIHAYEGTAVVESALAPFWRDRIVAVARFPCSFNTGTTR